MSKIIVIVVIAVICCVTDTMAQQYPTAERSNEMPNTDIVESAIEDLSRDIEKLRMSHEIMLEWHSDISESVNGQVESAILEIRAHNRALIILSSLFAFIFGGGLIGAFANAKKTATSEFEKVFRRFLRTRADHASELLSEAWRKISLKTDRRVLLLYPAETNAKSDSDQLMHGEQLADHVCRFLHAVGYARIESRQVNFAHFRIAGRYNLIIFVDPNNIAPDEEIQNIVDANKQSIFLILCTGRRDVKGINVNFANSLITLDSQAISCLQFQSEYTTSLSRR